MLKSLNVGRDRRPATVGESGFPTLFLFFVWSSYGITAAGLIGLTVSTLVSLGRASVELKYLEALAPRRRRRASGSSEAKETANAES